MGLLAAVGMNMHRAKFGTTTQGGYGFARIKNSGLVER